MFCSHIPNEQEETEWIARRGFVTKNSAQVTARKFLDELTIFSVSEPEKEAREQCSSARFLNRQDTSSLSSVSSSRVAVVDDYHHAGDHNKEGNSKSHDHPHYDEAGEEDLLWKAARDPHSGRTYYYHSVTRRTTWSKPEEIRALERRRKQQKKQRDKLFFKEMEANIYESIERGECMPGADPQESHEHMMDLLSTPVTETPSIEGTKQRVRTISGMDESLLAQLQIGSKCTATIASSAVVLPTTTAATSTTSYAVPPHRTVPVAAVDTRGRPPLPRRGMTKEKSSDSMSLSPEEDGAKFPTVMLSPHRDSELAGEKLLDGPLREDVKLEDEGMKSALAEGTEQARQMKNHIRRNTGGTIYVQSTMTNPDIKATIKCVCGVYRAHILHAVEKTASSSPVSVASHSRDELAETFLDDPATDEGGLGGGHPQMEGSTPNAVPSLDQVIAFYQDFFEKSQMELDTVIMSLIYVERLIKETDGLVVPKPENWKSVLFSCMVMASKVWDDLSMWNVDFSNVCGRNYTLASFTLRRINELELALLKCLNFIVRVPASEYAKYYFLIRSMLIKSGDLNEGGSGTGSGHRVHKPLDLKDAQKLETLSANYQPVQGNANNRRSRSLNDNDFVGIDHANEVEKVSPAARPSVCLEQLVTLPR